MTPTLLLPVHAKANGDFNDSGHAVFIISNSVDRNEVIAFAQVADGTLHESGKVPTGGRGSGGNNDPLESQGSLTLSQDHSLLFAVNAGSGEISVFDVLDAGQLERLYARLPSSSGLPNVPIF